MLNACMKFSLVETSDLPDQIVPNANASCKNRRVNEAAVQQTPTTVSTLLHIVLITLSINFY